MPSPYLAPSPDAPIAPISSSHVRSSDPFAEVPTQRCAPPAFLLELATPRALLEEATLRCAIPTILVDLPELDAPHPLSDTAARRSPFFPDDGAPRDREPVPALLDEDLFTDSSQTRAFLAPLCEASTVRYGDSCPAAAPSPAALLEPATARYGDSRPTPAPLPDFSTARYAPNDDAPAPLRDSSTVRHAPGARALTPRAALRESSTARCFVSRNGVHLPIAAPPAPNSPLDDRTARAFSFVDEDDAIHEILDDDYACDDDACDDYACDDYTSDADADADAIREIRDEPAAPHALPAASATCLAIPISFATEFDDSDEYNDFEPIPTILDSIPTLAAPQAPDSPPRWTIGLSRQEGLELVLAIPSVPPPPDGPFALSLPLRQQMITALEARVGVSLDSPVRRDLLNEDLRLPIVAGAVRICLDLDDGEVLFGAPLYHAWLAHERGLAALRHDPTRPGQRARTSQGHLT